MKIALFYGTCTGKTEAAADLIKDEFGEDFFDVCDDIAQHGVADLAEYDMIICGIPTWDVGEIQYDWQDVHDALDEVDLTGVKIAMFGMGDQGGYPDTFQDAIGMVYIKMLERGAEGGIGFTEVDTYDFTGSRGVIDGKFCGLALDDDCQPELTEQRIKDWVTQLKGELNLEKVDA
jgi:flavodoxin I